MIKYAILIHSIFTIFASESTDLVSTLLGEETNTPATVQHVTATEQEMLPPPMPLRRQVRETDPASIDYIVNNAALSDKLITMVRYLGTNGIKEDHIINLIQANPGKANPYSDSHRAHLIALACRDGYTSIVSAILESNPEALNCYNSGITPLDEALDFNKLDVARLLYRKGGIATSKYTCGTLRIRLINLLKSEVKMDEEKNSAFQSSDEESAEESENEVPYGPKNIKRQKLDH